MTKFFASYRLAVITFVLSLVLATAGTATAARLITSKDIKNGSIKEKDLAQSVRKKLNTAGAMGPKGEPGAHGPKGDTGAQGPAGPSWAAAGTAGGNSTQSILSDLTGYTVNGYPQTFTLPQEGAVLASSSVTIAISCDGSDSPTYSCATNWVLAIDGKPLKGSGFGTTASDPGPQSREITLYGTLADLSAGEHTLRVYTKQLFQGGATGSVSVVSWAFSVQRVGSIP